jgi:hypothetical protein
VSSLPKAFSHLQTASDFPFVYLPYLVVVHIIYWSNENGYIQDLCEFPFPVKSFFVFDLLSLTHGGLFQFEKGNHCFCDSKAGGVVETEDTVEAEVSGLTDDSSLVIDDAEQLWEEVDTEHDRGGNRDVKGRASELPSKSPSRSLFHSNYETPSRPPLRHKTGSPETAETVPSEDDWVAESEQSSVSDIGEIKTGVKREVTIFVDDYQPWTFELLVETLAANTVLTKVEIHRLRENTNRRVRTIEEMARFFKVIRGLPELQELVLCNFNVSDLDMITSLMFRHPNLEVLHLHLTDGTVDKAMLDILVDAPLLSDIVLDVQRSFPLSTLLDSKTLTNLRILSANFEFDEEHIVATMQALEHNDTLVTLDMGPKISCLGLRAMTFALEENNALEVLRFSFLADERKAGNALLDLSSALSRNSKLKTVQNYRSDSIRVRKRDCVRMLELLKCNETLKEFDFCYDNGYSISKQTILGENGEIIAGCGIATEWIMPCGDFKSWKSGNINTALKGWKEQILSIHKSV